MPISTRAKVTKVASRARENSRNPAFSFRDACWGAWDSGTSLAFRRAVTTGFYSNRMRAMFRPPLTTLKGRNTDSIMPATIVRGTPMYRGVMR